MLSLPLAVPFGGVEATGRPEAALTGVVLAGGRSRRMGRDKALLEWDGRALVDHVAARIAPVCAHVLLASGDGARLARPGEIPDAVVGPGTVSGSIGPLGGLLAALEAARTELVAVVAVDMPDADAGVLRVLAGRLAQLPRAPALVPLVEQRLQPLHAVYRRTAAPALRRLVKGGERSVVAAVRALGAVEAGPDVWGEADPEGRFARNLNRPDDLP